MGIYDREYYRDESGGGGWFSGTAPATRSLIAINVIMFLVQWMDETGGVFKFCYASGELIFRQFQVHRLFTAMFAQQSGGPIWFAVQMYFLYIIGQEMEGIYGSREFTYTYLAAGIVGTTAWAIVDVTRGAGGGYFGPDASILAAFVIFALYYPNREMLLFFVLPVRMWMLLAGVIGLNVVFALQSLKGGGGEIPRGGGGFIGLLSAAGYGWAYKAFDLRWSRLLRFRWPSRPRLRVVTPEPRERARTMAPGPITPRPSYAAEEPIEELVDEILAKIAREGRASLTDEEKRVLEEASRRARNKRSNRLH